MGDLEAADAERVETIITCCNGEMPERLCIKKTNATINLVSHWFLWTVAAMLIVFLVQAYVDQHAMRGELAPLSAAFAEHMRVERQYDAALAVLVPYSSHGAVYGVPPASAVLVHETLLGRLRRDAAVFGRELQCSRAGLSPGSEDLLCVFAVASE